MHVWEAASSSLPYGGRTRGKSVGELIHSDVCGPMSVSSPGGSRYFVTFKDDFSGYCVIHFLKSKSDVAPLFQQFVRRVQVETGKQVTVLRSDNGGEYFRKDFENWLLETGIRHERSTPYTPEHNGVAERLYRTILESARSMLHFAKLPLELWAEACNCAVYLLNRVAIKAVEDNTPFEIWKGMKPNVSHVRVFVHIPKEKRSKLDRKPIKCDHVGYCENQKAFRAWDPVARTLHISRDMIFQELVDGRMGELPGGIFDLVSDFFSESCHSSNEVREVPGSGESSASSTGDDGVRLEREVNALPSSNQLASSRRSREQRQRVFESAKLRQPNHPSQGSEGRL